MPEPANHSEAADQRAVAANDWRLDATTPHVAALNDDHDVHELISKETKPLRDLAFAAALRSSGLITEGQLALATRNWTAFGVQSLAEHLQANEITTAHQTAAICKTADVAFAEVMKNRSDLLRSVDTDPQRGLIMALNPDGRLASLLGLIGRSSVINGVIEDRSVGARYTLLRKLGQGGLGTVWLARDENLSRYVAVKELTREAGANDVALEHFRREAEITGRLEHPGIVPIYQFGHDEKSGKAFYAMRFLGRRTLQDAIEEYHERRSSGGDDRILLHRLLTSFVSVCHSVGHAHAQNVIHRDLKPANVALDEFGQVTLLDWGLSKVNDHTGMYDVTGRPEPGDLHDMSSGYGARVIGTPLYMAPEQAAGRLEDVDELTDVYGLGGILYTILTGVGPHQTTAQGGNTVIGREDFLSRIVSDEVVPPEVRTSGVPPELNAICLKALSSRRYRRYQSAAELAEEIQCYMAGAPVRAYDAPLQRRISRWMVRHPTLAQIALLSVSLVLIAGIAIALIAREGRQRLAQARFGSAVETTRDLEVNLTLEASALERDLHFITELPLMAAITESQIALRSQSAASDADVVAATESPTTEAVDQNVVKSPAANPAPAVRPGNALNAALQTPEQWLERQSELFDGFLRANPAYLMMTTCIREEAHQFRELARSERVTAGLRSQRVLSRQLKMADTSATAEDMELLDQLRPGAVLLVTNDQFSGGIPTHNRSPLVLSGVAAVYDTAGDFFGLNAIELDLGEKLRTLLPAIAPEYVNVLVTDAAGRIVMDYRDGRFMEVSGSESVLHAFPELAELFQQDSSVRELGDGQTVYATLVQLGQPSAPAQVGIVASIADRK